MEQRLSIEGMHFHSKHGYYAHEQENGGDYLVDVSLDLDLTAAGQSDQLEDTLNYELIYQLVSEIMAKPHHLIESLCYEIGTRIISSFSQVKKSSIKVIKLNPPLSGEVDRTTVLMVFEGASFSSIGSNYWEERAKY